MVLPRGVCAQALREPLFAGLVPTDIGWYPAARGHRRERAAGAEEHIFLHCVAGAGWLEAGGIRRVVTAGELLILPAGQAHAYGADEARPWTLRWFHLAGRDLPELCAALGAGARAGCCGLPDDAVFTELFGDALEALEAGYTSTHLLRASRALGHYLARSVWLVRHPATEAAAPDASRRVARCVEHMRRHLERPLRVAELAALAGWSPSHFKARFRREVGYGCIDYFIRLRIHAACQLLDATSLEIKAVAVRVGYADALWFSKAFRGVTGMSPSEYRGRAKG